MVFLADEGVVKVLVGGHLRVVAVAVSGGDQSHQQEESGQGVLKETGDKYSMSVTWGQLQHFSDRGQLQHVSDRGQLQHLSDRGTTTAFK